MNAVHCHSRQGEMGAGLGGVPTEGSPLAGRRLQPTAVVSLKTLGGDSQFVMDNFDGERIIEKIVGTPTANFKSSLAHREKPQE